MITDIDFGRGPHADEPFRTITGQEIYLLAPDPAFINIHDIACSLGNAAHMLGHTRPFYSVAQHSIMVMKHSPDNLKRAALLHDAAQAYLGTIGTPFKAILGILMERVEGSILDAVSYKFRISRNELYDVAYINEQVQSIEREYFWNGNERKWKEFCRTNRVDPEILLPHEASSMFLSEYFRLFTETMGHT